MSRHSQWMNIHRKQQRMENNDSKTDFPARSAYFEEDPQDNMSDDFNQLDISTFGSFEQQSSVRLDSNWSQGQLPDQMEGAIGGVVDQHIDNESDVSDIESLLLSDDDDDLSDQLEENTSVNEFGRKYVQMCDHLGLTLHASDYILKFIKKCNILQAKTCQEYKTLRARLIKESINSRNFEKCINCGQIKRQEANKMTCDSCDHTTTVVPFSEPYVEFDIVEQLQRLSNRLELDEPLEDDGSLVIRLQVTCDAIPLSDSSNTSLVPIILFIKNFESNRKRNQNYVVSSFFISRKDKIDYKTLFAPLLEQLNPNSRRNRFPIVTKWSQRTHITIDSLLADAPCRAIILNHKNHSGDFPCHRCQASLRVIVVDEKQKRQVDILTSAELEPKDFRFYDLCVESARRQNLDAVAGKFIHN